jgi:hypothetical protein
LCVISSPITPSPRVAALTSFPCSYNNETDNPSILNSHIYCGFIPSFLIFSSNAIISLSEKTLLKNITVDVSPLLKTELGMVNDISRMRNSSQSSYIYGDKIDLGYINELNFGVIAGVNNGSITNAKIIATTYGDHTGATDSEGMLQQRIYLHVLTTQGTLNDDFIISNIGGIVGHNSETGAISNSFVGVRITESDNSDGNHYITGISAPNSIERNNTGENLDDKIQVYPFVLAGGNNLGGLACINDGVISNSYAKGLGIYNSYPAVENSATGGLVTYNNNLITSSFVEGDTIENYRAVENRFIIESTGYIGGLVYQNNATIENSYTNAYIQTLSSFLGGFVYVNNANGTISNSYTTAVNRNSLAVGQFTGVKQGVTQNFGAYNNCYYLVDDTNADRREFENVKENAVAILKSRNDFDNPAAWSGFSFVAGAQEDGIWSVTSGSEKTPRLVATLTDTISFRELLVSEDEEDVDIENDSATGNNQ